MDWLEEEVLGGTPPGMQPVAVPATAQKLAGWILRICGALLFVAAACFTMLWSMGMISMLLDAVDASWILLVGGYIAGEFAVMVLGSLMGSFGEMLTGPKKRIEGRDFARWAVLETLRNISFVLGVLLLLWALGLVLIWQGVAAAGWMLLLATILLLPGAKAHRAIRRLQAS